MRIVAVTGRKGGIGKSTIAGNLAGEFNALGKKVLVLDADPQHSIACWGDQGKGLLSRAVVKVDGDFPGDLRQQLRRVPADLDVAIVDTPPGIGELAWETALFADLVLLPCGPSPLDLHAMKGALALALKARAQRKSKKPRIRLVPSRVTMNTSLGRGLAASLEEMGRKVLPPITQRVVFAEAVLHGLTMAEYAPSSPGRAEFQLLAQSVEKILRKG